MLASGMTHELNNPLSIIMGYAELTLQQPLNIGILLTRVSRPAPSLGVFAIDPGQPVPSNVIDAGPREGSLFLTNYRY